MRSCGFLWCSGISRDTCGIPKGNIASCLSSASDGFISAVNHVNRWEDHGIIWKHMALGQNLVALVNIKIAGKWVFTPLTLIIIGFDTHPYGNGSKIGYQMTQIRMVISSWKPSIWSLNNFEPYPYVYNLY